MSANNNQSDKSTNKVYLEEDVSIHLFSTSATMVGVCLTVIGIFQIGSLKAIGSISDNILAIDAIGFLISCVLSYVALRTRTTNRRYLLERVADMIFIASLSLMAIVCILVAYTFI